MENLKEKAISRMVNDYGWSKTSAKIFVEMYYKVDKTLKNIDWDKIKNYKAKKGFVCEICNCLTPIECEGREPNTCAMCMPILFDDIDGEFID